MLVLSRRIGETLKIGDDIEIQILDIQRGQIRIGINAPKRVNIVRSELLDRPRSSDMTDSVTPTTNNDRPAIRVLRRRSY